MLTNYSKQQGKIVIGLAGAGALIGFLFLAITMFSSVYKIGEHEVGVMIDNGEIQDELLTPGINFKKPFITSIERIPSTLQERERQGVSAASSDNYNIKDSVIEYSYRIPRNNAMDVYRNFPNYESVLNNEFNSAAKNILGQYRMMNIPRKRTEIGQKIKERVIESVADKMGVDIVSADISGYSWEREARQYLSQVKKAESQQDVEREKLKQVELENERKDKKQKSDIARKDKRQEAENRRMVEKAEAQAESDIIESEAEAESMKVIATVLSDHPKLIERQRIQAWNGKLPMVQGNADARIDFKGSDLSNSQ